MENPQSTWESWNDNSTHSPVKCVLEEDRFASHETSPCIGFYASEPSDTPLQGHKCVYTSGDTVQVWSRTEQNWIEAKVMNVMPDGTVTVSYRDQQLQKTLSQDQQSEWLRPMVESTEEQDSKGFNGAQGDLREPLQRPLLNDSLKKHEAEHNRCHMKQNLHDKNIHRNNSAYLQGQIVQVWSQSQNKWVQAQVTTVLADGSIVVLYSEQQLQKTLSREIQKDWVKPLAKVAKEFEIPAAPLYRCGRSWLGNESPGIPRHYDFLSGTIRLGHQPTAR